MNAGARNDDFFDLFRIEAKIYNEITLLRGRGVNNYS